MDFVIYDIIFLVLFSLFVAWFLWKNKKRLGKDGILYLYRTKWGMNLIDKIGGKYTKTLDVLRLLIIPTSYVLMIGILYLIFKTVYDYIWNTLLIDAIGNSPPIALVIPYFPRLFGLSDFFPPFYFVYFLFAILIVAGVHEFSHGIFMRRYGIKIKSTGIAFLGPILGAFVEQDEKDMLKAKKLDQMTVLGAGVFANLVTAIIFFMLLVWFFNSAFSPVGIIFDSYTYSPIEISAITMMGNVSLNNPTYQEVLSLMPEEGIQKIRANEKNYLATKSLLEQEAIRLLVEKQGQIILYDDAPAINYELKGVVTQVNGVKINSIDLFSDELNKYAPGQSVTITTLTRDESGEFVSKNQEIVLGENPQDETKPYLGVGFSTKESKLPKHVFHFLASSRPSQLPLIENVYYQEDIEGVSEFVYYLFWWIIMINFLVALFNMVPAGIFDGGRFFYLTVLGITKNEKIARRSSGLLGYLFLFFLFLIVATWLIRWIF